MMKAVFLSILAFVLLSAGTHPIHVSVTEITLDEKEKELEIVSRIFIDDLETAIRESTKQPELKLLEPGTGTTTDQLVSSYLLPRFKVLMKGKAQKIKYLGHEIENDAMICYIQVINVKRLDTIEVFNSVITELHEDQSNLVHVTVKDKVKSLRLMRDNPSGKLTFETK
jgi:hypothetical protein